MAQLIASSPLSSPPLDCSFTGQTAGPDIDRKYRTSRDLPFELAQHVQTYYEESLFTQAYTFLLSITGNSISPVNRAAPVTIPSAPHLALAATVSVHPTFTTRTTSREKWEQANLAVRLLRLVQQTVGPENGNVLGAFSFQKNDSRSSRRAHFEDDEDEYQGTRNTDPLSSDLNTSYAGSQSVWTRADDFWHLVGWAFNCACLPGVHAKRWRRYQVLLEHMLDVLETDWELREQSNSTEESLIWHYIELAAGGHARERRILRAIFADGSTRSTNEFRPIFAHELKEPPTENPKDGGGIKKREVDVDFEHDVFGDYLMQDDSDASDDGDSWARGPGRPPSKRTRTRTRTPSSRRLTPRASAGSLRSDYDAGDEVLSSAKLATQKSSPTAGDLGDHASLDLRLRLLSLLTHISSHPTLTATSPTTFPDPEGLFTLLVEFIKPLPLPIFTYFVLPTPTTSSPLLTLQTSMTLSELLLQRLLEPSAPSIRSHVLLSQHKLETEYLPFAAARNTADANARVSVLLESLTRCLVAVDAGTLSAADGALARAVQTGVVRRLGRVADVDFHADVGGAAAVAGAAVKKKKKTTNKAKAGGVGGGVESANDEAWACLVESGARIADVVRHAAAVTSASTTA